MPELSAPLTQRLVEVLDCTLTLHRGVDDRSTTVSVTVSCGWNPDDVEEVDRDLLAGRVWSEPDEEGWLTAEIAALHGYLFDLSEPDVDQADEISTLSGSRTRVRAFAPWRYGWSRCLSVFADQAAEDVGPFNGLAGILASDESLACEGWPLVKGSVWSVAVVAAYSARTDRS